MNIKTTVLTASYFLVPNRPKEYNKTISVLTRKRIQILMQNPNLLIIES